MGLNLGLNVAGYYKMEAIKVDSNGNEVSKRILADWFPNLVTNGGLDRIAKNFDWLNYCQVGTSNTTPAVTDTALVAYLANTATKEATHDCLAISPYYAWRKTVYTFAVGAAAGNLSEVGVGWATSGSLFSRALILDDLGDPTTITVLSDEILNVTYEVRFQPKLTDTTDTTVFTGSIGGTYDWIFRSAQCGQTAYWKLQGSTTMRMSHITATTVRDGDIGVLTSAPTGDSDSITLEVDSYVTSSYELDYLCSLTLGEGNFGTGIRSLWVDTGMGSYQLQFDPAIPKTSADTLSFVVKIGWGRA